MIEVATFRRQVDAGADGRATERSCRPRTSPRAEDDLDDGHAAHRPRADDQLIHRDNTFGTPEEDAFRRDFTINALFYDIATFSIIDYVGGLEDLRRRPRCAAIGDPDVRFREDPVRMLRAVALAARLDFTIDEPILDAIAAHRHEIARSSPPRLLEEYYKILRAGHAEKAFPQLRATGLLEPITPELRRAPASRCGGRSPRSIATARRFDSTPDTLTNAILPAPCSCRSASPAGGRASPPTRSSAASSSGMLPLARRDVERLRQILALQRRLLDLHAPSARAARAAAPRRARRSADLAGDSRRAAGRGRALARAAAGARPRPPLPDEAGDRPPTTPFRAASARAVGRGARAVASRTSVPRSDRGHILARYDSGSATKR